MNAVLYVKANLVTKCEDVCRHLSSDVKSVYY